MTGRALGVDFQLRRNAMGKLVLTFNGQTHEGVMPVRAFPISAPAGGLSLVTGDGREVLWLDSLDSAPAAARALIEEDLAGREFMPEIRRIASVSTYATPSTWQVETDRGDTHFVLRGEEDIRRLAGQTLLISDSHGIHYLIRDALALDRHSRKILDRFL
ncbi:DUF1854 domain-containing protein [Bordetella pseudohinzii]|uniref:Domain of uncharacterized function (DUF1854) n=1 Tax=Bordetella pseudohinzii TaxID=1331258 RepID=A0A0J6F3R0_9BORD|nr:DUF1854 domain-containing protein [Bordetella pseudohinzii]ANY15579.1 hypothetical protein BBN53_06495 [Bordetella pseudohinzii]KMM27100.1 hypothetical protein L540_08880 [Bordetella pseudohinzii]KXA82299.1 hypothetical protein AW877_02435 [Bordetella pseudohinzii]KXA82705.1 hypothetical protein AW878_01560 [Bordetella pseudohinzii]CUI56825.1 Domain of uncharacterised function (DUF1854) [Bordetella pseudohinzii]